ncbi:Acyl-CoA:1-acyl-sn-glycerol-3-phosphate acyltransferase [Pseudomonas chlororaphis subsp. aurantiaca]|jgi:1-acyl-sn-glycerol-3-phosphate acyltransferase|uniref:1-acyl-sn-glycerol-3-phosphate acyltransferase n=1 Tax=Pseudomonas chlororaphis TaxID=587753 RepID=A0AAP9VUX5_9PSED|nr:MULTISPECIES: lysophospholipid acyltransferase family protein [Pseudomonas]AIS10166.1 acyl-phosphate glycerol 3-phosphate acyltransferase [Pseudomonas chlororaphis subsp. aurantiaca]AUG44048.1 1-acyl-sn-glycerol-3-phosphate acyltransferase [Pseudomonas chlororaphis]AZD25415.1 Acyl-CoA:1-acyl-sn-glycerol-3-phosphate acyltransferase [Pseudomonas chlororaphis subsp. aurantiaca]AZD39062.1 Acyl-CoA:1-acyl-sn-glycerol-3-phosphate acyltransferase [Pseudomonas chlororaphis subsp. aurantiaca]AZD4540
MLEPLVATLITSAARTITGARSLWLGCGPQAVQRIYFANHSSHGDFVLLWASLPPALRKVTRPVAGADYWQTRPLRRYIINRVFNGVLIDRERKEPVDNPLQPMLDALANGDSLIIFPEGTRNLEEEGLLPFKSGLYHLAKSYPQAQVIPVWIANLNRVMPKGRFLPLPLLCTTSFGAPLSLEDGESKEQFLERSRAALLAMAPEHS